VNGIWVAGQPVEVAGWLGTVTFSHCTMAPVQSHATDGDPGSDGPSSLELRDTSASVVIDRCVVGRIRVDEPEVFADPCPMSVVGSIIDATARGGAAIAAPDGAPAFVILALHQTTVLGGASVHQVDVVEDSLLTAPLRSARRQVGAVRWSYLPPGSRTPQRFECQPDSALADVDARMLDPTTRERLRAQTLAALTPRFDNTTFGTPGYGRLSQAAADQLLRGAADEGELGALHDQRIAQRAAGLRDRLQQSVPVGFDIDIIFAT
jgi:hypothetical protein